MMVEEVFFTLDTMRKLVFVFVFVLVFVFVFVVVFGQSRWGWRGKRSRCLICILFRFVLPFSGHSYSF